VPWWQYVLGAVYVLTIFYLPSGLMGIPERIRRRGGALGKREKLTAAPSGRRGTHREHGNKETGQ
jgi:hypothetical protein